VGIGSLALQVCTVDTFVYNSWAISYVSVISDPYVVGYSFYLVTIHKFVNHCTIINT